MNGQSLLSIWEDAEQHSNVTKHYQNHLESVKGHFSSILMKALLMDGPTNRWTDKASYRDARTHLEKQQNDLQQSLNCERTM